MNQATYEVAEIITEFKEKFYQKHDVLKYHKKVFHALEICRTAALGGHIDQCDDCGYTRNSYNSCRNRHCPKCQNTNKELWIYNQQQNLLDTTYFHVVFTLPQELNIFCLKYPTELYSILFSASRETIEVFSKDKKHLGAETGMISLLHTWGQNLSLHPHIHCIIPGGGITKSGYWIRAKNEGKFLFPVKAMSVIYRAKFMEKFSGILKKKGIVFGSETRKKLFEKHWVIYAKEPFSGPNQVIEYLGRYTHKVAISNHRIISIDKENVSFRWKDYTDGNKQKEMTLKGEDFLRRFSMHILPPKFMKIRHYGFLANRSRKKLELQQMKMGIVREKKKKINWKEIAKTKLNFDSEVCPCCSGKMKTVLTFLANAPPEYLKIFSH